MNRYHENHPDPEIRKKYQDWMALKNAYDVRAAGFKTMSEMTADKAKRKETEKLNRIFGGNRIKKTTTKKPAASSRLQRTGGQRGS